jgi:hypothetical protein
MRKCILSAIAGALAMLILIIVAANVSTEEGHVPEDYEHIDYISSITQEECYVCSNTKEFSGFLYWGEDNVGIVNLNTFELLRLEINRYDDQCNLIEEPAGFMSSSGMSNEETESHAHAYCFPDNAYADVQLSGVQYAIDRDSVQNHLCQTCLDSINDLWFTDMPPAEYAIVSFENRTIQPLLNAHPWFSAGNYGIDCEFMDGGAVDLLIHYCPQRYQ